MSENFTLRQVLILVSTRNVNRPTVSNYLILNPRPKVHAERCDL